MSTMFIFHLFFTMVFICLRYRHDHSYYMLLSPYSSDHHDDRDSFFLVQQKKHLHSHQLKIQYLALASQKCGDAWPNRQLLDIEECWTTRSWRWRVVNSHIFGCWKIMCMGHGQTIWQTTIKSHHVQFAVLVLVQNKWDCKMTLLDYFFLWIAPQIRFWAVIWKNHGVLQNMIRYVLFGFKKQLRWSMHLLYLVPNKFHFVSQHSLIFSMLLFVLVASFWPMSHLVQVRTVQMLISYFLSGCIILGDGPTILLINSSYVCCRGLSSTTCTSEITINNTTTEPNSHIKLSISNQKPTNMNRIQLN